MGKAIGLLEIKSVAGMIEAADAMLKAADVRIVGKERIVGGLMTVIVEGEVAAVRISVEAGAAAAKRVGEVISMYVIPRPYEETEKLLPG